MTNLTKKIVAVVTTISAVAWALPVGAITAAELQVQIDALMAQLATLQTQLATLQATPTVTGCAVSSFDRNLSQGMTGDDVKCLQITLNSDSVTQVAASGIGSSGNETSYFGSLTKAAVVKFQEKYASEVLTPIGLTAGTGFVGVKTLAKLNTLLGVTVPITPVTPTPTGAVTISLASDTPIAASVALGAQDVVFTKFTLTGGSTGVTITKVIVSRGGVSADVDLSAIKLFDGTKQLGSTQALNTITHKATFTGLSWAIAAGETKALTIKGNIAAKGTATVGDSITLGIGLASDITSSVALGGTFPIYGNAKSLAGIAVGELYVEKQTSPATNTNMLSGAVDQEIASWKFTASTTEGVAVHSIKVTHTGSATRDDVVNIKLKISGVQIGETVAKLDSSNAASFDLSSSPISITAGSSKTVYAYADIASGIWTSRTVIFEITQYTDVVAYGTNSGGAMVAANNDTTTFSKQTGNTMTIGQGDLTIAVDASLNPAAQNYVKGTTQRLISAFKFSTGSREGVRITELKLTFSGTVTDISNITLWDGSTQVGGSASAIGSYVTFGANTIGWDETGLFDVAKSSNKTVQVKADIPSGATAGNTIELYVNAASEVKADGLDSKYDIASTAITVTSAGSANTNAHSIVTKGSLAASKSALTPPAQTYVKGATEKEFLRMNLTADSGEEIAVTSIQVNCYRGGGEACVSGDITSLKVLKSDGSQFGTTAASPSASASFSGTSNIAASQTESLKFIANIPSTSNATSGGIYFELASSSDSIVSTGLSSAAEIFETGLVVTGNTMGIGAGELIISAAAVPGDQSLIKGATEVSFVGLVIAAGTAENIRATYIKLFVSSLGEASTTDVSNIALWDGTTRLTTKKALDAASSGYHHYVSWSASDFLNSSGIELVKGQQKTVTVKADLPGTATAAHTIAFGIASSTESSAAATATTSDVTFVGLSSNTTPAARVTLGTNLGGVNYTQTKNAGASYVTVQAAGTLTVSAAADTPEIGIVAVGPYTAGASNVAFTKLKFEATRENIDITSIKVTRLNNTDVNFASIGLWDGTTQLGGDGNQSLANATTTFNFPAGSYWRITAGTAKYLTIKANLSGMETVDYTGAVTGHAPKLCIPASGSNLELGTLGISSGVTTITASASAANTALCGNVQIIRQSKPSMSAASLPSTVYGAGTKTLYRWTLTADSKGEIGWKKAIFEISGSVTVAGTAYTVGMGTSSAGALNYAVYAGTSTNITAANHSLITSLKVYNVATNDEITASTTPFVYNDPTNGGAKVIFHANSEQVIAANETKTYELRGNISAGGASGDSVSTKINAVSTATTTGSFVTVAGGAFQEATSTDVSFVWTDRSGAATSGGHTTFGTADWTNDYKVTGIPTASLSLSR